LLHEWAVACQSAEHLFLVSRSLKSIKHLDALHRSGVLEAKLKPKLKKIAKCFISLYQSEAKTTLTFSSNASAFPKLLHTNPKPGFKNLKPGFAQIKILSKRKAKKK